MYFKRFARKVTLISIFIINAANMNAKPGGGASFDWAPVMDAITQVESEGDAKAINGIYAGAMQIAPIMVDDCNEILRQRGLKKRFTMNDRFSKKKSREMFVIFQSKYNPQNDVEHAIRLWNGGHKYKKKSTQRYYQKVMAALK